METETDRIVVHPASGKVSGSVRIPRSKSITNRAITLAVSSTGTSLITNPLFSDDTERGLDAAQALGCEVLVRDDEIEITGIGRRRPVPQATSNVGSAGKIARFLPCVLAFGEPGEWHLASSAQMAKRPIDGLGAALNQLGDPLEYSENPGRYPITVRGARIRSSVAHVDGGVSSQYLSGLLLAAPMHTTPIRITTDGAVVQSQYVRMTIDCMRRFGVRVEASDDLSRIDVEPVEYRATKLDVEADASTATYFAALPAVAGGAIELTNLARASRQPDIQFVEILTPFGCTADWTGDFGVRIRRPQGLTRLRGGHQFNLNACSDVALTVAALSAFADAPVEISGVEHIRHHECDRIDAMTVVLRAVGARVQERPDGWLIEPGSVRWAEVQTRDDHRMAMASALIGIGGRGISLDHPACVAKTFPTFFELLSGLGLSSDRTAASR